MRHYYFHIVLVTLLSIPSIASAQSDSTTSIVAIKPDTTLKLSKKEFVPNPKKAGMYSSIMPGLGQIYNRQYWKLPIVYAGVAAAGYFIQSNLSQYRTYRKAYIYRIDNDPSTVDEFAGRYSEQDLKSLQDGFRGYLDITVLVTAVGYSLQILDAVASAHLRNFDVSPSISMQMQPVIQPNYIGAGLVVNFK
ncbi:MAG: DUF5683 domain-containing protein [Flavipsychrobacter sp.]